MNGNFEKAQGRPYLGSRDIDLGFHMTEQSTLSETIAILKKLKFKPLSFRFVKEIHTESEEEIGDGEIVPSYFIFPMCVDLIVDYIPHDFKKNFGFNPIDEPLLKVVFERKEYTLLIEFGKRLFVPTPELLLAMKINSLPSRDKEHKRIKDICDLFALLWYTRINSKKVAKYAPEKNIMACLQTIETDDLEKASVQLGHSADELRRVIGLLGNF